MGLPTDDVGLVAATVAVHTLGYVYFCWRPRRREVLFVVFVAWLTCIAAATSINLDGASLWTVAVTVAAVVGMMVILATLPGPIGWAVLTYLIVSWYVDPYWVAVLAGAMVFFVLFLARKVYRDLVELLWLAMQLSLLGPGAVVMMAIRKDYAVLTQPWLFLAAMPFVALLVSRDVYERHVRAEDSADDKDGLLDTL